MASAFSSSDTAILTAPVELDPLLQSATAAAQSADIRELYEVEQTAASILQYGFRSIALQFPDEALIDSVPVYWALRDELARLLSERKANRQSTNEGTVGQGSSTGQNRSNEVAQDDQVPELYILADTSYGNCCVDEVAAAHVDADLVVHYGHTCLSQTANLPALYVFPRLPIDPAHTATSLASYVQSNLKLPGSGKKTLVLAYDVAYAHASDQVLNHLRASNELKEAGYETHAMSIDAGNSFKTKLGKRKRGEAGCCQSQSGSCGSCDCRRTSVSEPSKDSETASEQKEPHIKIAPMAAMCSTKDDAMHTGLEKVALTSGRFVYLPAGQRLNPETSAVLYIGPESRALTNLLLHLGPAFPVVSYDPTRHDAASNLDAQRSPVRLETGKTNRLLMQRYGMVQRARDASVVGLLVGTLGVASYLPLLDRLRARLTGTDSNGAAAQRSGHSSRRKVYTVSVGKLNPAKLANFQEVEVWVLVACPENSLVGSKSGLGPSGAGASGSLSGASGHGGDFWRPIVTPYEMELALGPEGVWTGEYEVDLAKLADKLEETKVAEQDTGPGRTAAADQDGTEDVSDEDDDRPHYSFVTGTYVSRTKYGASAAPPEEGDERSGGTGKPSTVIAVRGGKEVAVIQSASRLTHIGGSGRIVEREWAGLTRPEGGERFVPSVLEVGRTGVAGGYSHAHGEAEGTS